MSSLSSSPVIACISHKEDVDGLCSAALIKNAFNAERVILVDYANLIPKLEKVAQQSSENKLDRLYICDLGLSKKNEQKFADILEKIISNKTEVVYIDHHDISKDTASRLKKIGVVLIHSVEECTSVQVYNKYKRKFSSHAAFLAAAGALTDYLETKPIASVLVSRFDRQFLMLESTALSYIISSNQNDEDFLVKIVETLANMKYPHDIEGGFLMAERYAIKVSQAIKTIESSIVKYNNIAYAQSGPDSSASMIVNFVLGLSEKPVAVVYKLKEEIDAYILSIRGSADCRVHLGRLVNQLASEIGGSGGGHDKACGAVIPKDKLQIFLHTLDKRISEK